MSERADLHRAILAAPDDDAPRLVFADWLDEHGEPDQAEFIRLQCATDRLPPTSRRWQSLHDRAQRLLRDWRADWAASTMERVLRADFRRGFVDGVTLTIDHFVSGADDLLALEPIRMWEFREVAFFHRSPPLTSLALHPAFDRVRGLAVGEFAPDELVTAIAGSPHLNGLRSLSISYHRPGPEALKALFAAAPVLDHLEAANSPVSNFRDLWKRGAPPRLRRLSLAHCRVTDHAVEQLALSPAVGQLEILRLDMNGVSEYTAEAIAASAHLSGLRELSLAHTSLGDRGVMALARTPTLQNLRVLNLANCYLDNADAQSLADSPYLNELECLCLDGNRISAEVEVELTKRFGGALCPIAWP
ncbi:MAG TPA: TIGR02996 domain-containing protein [Gemmataceae bacterium]|nr:TIGR02996 domain-containing protein [Gemmataceae bacterium]